jgi:hypothetical protein
MRIFLLVLIFMQQLGAHMMHKETVCQEWIEEQVSPFDELMISWNAARPEKGKYLIYASVKIEEQWTPWLLYSEWGKEGQASFSNTADGVKVYQDALEVLEGKKATAFQIRTAAEEGADVNGIWALHVYTNGDRLAKETPELPTVLLDVEGLSQMVLPHPRHKDLCSPTSTAIVTRFLSKNQDIDPNEFAQEAWDGGFDIYGNWVFNVAAAASKLGPKWHCWVERLNGFEDLHARLMEGTPVIVSVRGPLPGSALPYAKGHLMVVKGYDAADKRVLCLDPAFPEDEKTAVSYDLNDFMEAWNRRGRVAYVFHRAVY